MNIAYVAQTEASTESGVNKKLVDQVTSWVRLGHQVRLHLLSRSRERWAGWARINTDVYTYANAFASLSASGQLVSSVLRSCPDVVYCRTGVPYPAFFRLARTRRVIAEVNTDDEAQARVRMGTLKSLVYSHGVRTLLARSIGAVSVSTSVGDKLRARGMEVLVLGNSIDMSLYPHSPAPHNQQPRLVFLGSGGCVWHGLDKLKALAQRFSHWIVDVVGLTKAEFPGDWPPNVRFHGFMPFQQYRSILNSADVAIGTLALHRKGMTETSALKVREYLAIGLPVIIGHPDPDFTVRADYVLELPNAEDNVSSHLDLIHAFVTAWRGRRVERSAVEHLDVRVKEARRLAFFHERLASHDRY
jgi:hypothetical protein